MDLGISSFLDIVVLFLDKRGIDIHYMSLLRGLLKDLHVLILVVLFCFTPTYLSMIGVNLVGIIIPLSKTVELLIPMNSKKRLSRNDSSQTEFLLHYWLSFGIFWAVRIYLFAFWPSISMLMLFMLQNSYLQGASWIIQEVKSIFKMIIDRNGQRSSRLRNIYQTPESASPNFPDTSARASQVESSSRSKEDLNPLELREKLLDISKEEEIDCTEVIQPNTSAVRRRGRSQNIGTGH